jgi:hypothetical protein
VFILHSLRIVLLVNNFGYELVLLKVVAIVVFAKITRGWKTVEIIELFKEDTAA